jgi:hypothetical protein
MLAMFASSLNRRGVLSCKTTTMKNLYPIPENITHFGGKHNPLQNRNIQRQTARFYVFYKDHTRVYIASEASQGWKGQGYLT